MAHIESYRDLIVWQKGLVLVKEIYSLTGLFPPSERYGLITQMRRAAVSIPTNIAEGRRRGSRKDYRNFLIIAYGSGAELETLIEISAMLPEIRQISFSTASSLLNEIMRMLNVTIQKLAPQN